MPLLKRKAFEKSTASEYLRDEDEVFHCEITDEIFKDYEEYCERIILVNSMVWSCEMTGKNNLTYSEALESEKAARKSLKNFPIELRIPILYLVTKTKRCSFAEVCEDVFNYVRERYFVGETIEACLEEESWQEAHILSVIAPKQQPGSKVMLQPQAYTYEVEHFTDGSDAGQSGTLSHDKIRRRKGDFSREKCRLFLKQFVQMDSGIIGIKKSALDKYNISKVKFDQIFTGAPPEFPSSKKLIKTSLSPPSAKKPGSATKLNKSKKNTPDKKGQQSMDKFVKKTDATTPKQKQPNPEAKKNAQELAEKMRRAEEQMRQRKEDEKARKKEKNARLQAYLKEWQKVKDDLLLEDHKVIPHGTPIYLEGISHEHVGDFLSVLEFVYLYADTLKTKDVFHNGMDIETFRKALVSKEHCGVFSDLVQMMLTTIFSLQEDEAEEYNEGGRIAESNEDNALTGEVGVTKAVELATKACKWSQTYLGTPLSKLPLDPTTVSEVLRLHLLSSGAVAGSRCAAWRYQQRGGYSGADDAGLRLRVTHPAVLRRLATRHVADMDIDDKFKILQCLMNQILSYATVRDIIEEKLESYKTMKVELRSIQIQERRREMELIAAKSKLKKEMVAKREEEKLTGDKAKALEEELERNLNKLNEEGETKKAQYKKKLAQLQSDCFNHVSYLGTDRAYRRYFLNQCVEGLFVEAGDENRGPCLDKPVLPAARDEDTLTYVTKLFENEKGGSDKENDSGANSRGNSPKKPLSNLNGLTQKLNGLDSTTQQLKELLVCTGDISTCYVHGKADYRPQWWFYHTEEQLDGLIQSLNKRGIRESDLKQNLEIDKVNIVDYLKKAPVSMLNPTVFPPPPVTLTRHRKHQPSMTVPADCSISEALELSLRDYILEFEEKIFHGCLGSVKVKDREAWRGTIMLRGYDKQATYLTWGPHRQYRDDCHLPNGVMRIPEDIDKEATPIPENKYRDPGFYLGDGKVNGVKVEVKREGEQTPDVVRALASALLQIEQGIHHKYLKRPLGFDDKERKDREARGKSMDMEALERWEISLMECRSFAQIFLHLFTLDTSVSWSASILNASCRICRRKTDPDNMLLCDKCNKGHHLYCLKPKLTKVPEGDWFCDMCKPKEEKTPRKRRKLFSDEDVEEVLNEESDSSSSDIDTGVCGSCGSGGRLAVSCTSCSGRFHHECAVSYSRRGGFVCNGCQGGGGREVRRCAAEAISNIHHYARALNDTAPLTSDSEESDDNTALVNLRHRKGRKHSEDSDDTALVNLRQRKGRRSKEDSPIVNGLTNGHAKRSRRSKEESRQSRKSRTSDATTPLTNGVHEERGSGRKRGKEPLIHSSELQQLLRDVMKHKDCWPFYEAVNTSDVPDYLEVIDTPMDFTTIKSKLERGQYRTDTDLINDAMLVFINCYTYNQETHPVAKAGVRLEKYFNKRATELNLPTLPDIQVEEQMIKTIKRAAEEALPGAKRQKTK